MKQAHINRLKKLEDGISSGLITHKDMACRLGSLSLRKGCSEFEDAMISILEKNIEKNVQDADILAAKVGKEKKPYFLWTDHDTNDRRAHASVYLKKHGRRIRGILDLIPANMQGYIYDLIKDSYKSGFKDGAVIERSLNEPVRIGGMN
jgi:hypothetical protein